MLHWCNRQIAEGRVLLIHCKCGRNRSPALVSALASWVTSQPVDSQASWATISSAFLYDAEPGGNHNLCITPFMYDYGSTFYYHPGIWVQ